MTSISRTAGGFNVAFRVGATSPGRCATGETSLKNKEVFGHASLVAYGLTITTTEQRCLGVRNSAWRGGRQHQRAEAATISG